MARRWGRGSTCSFIDDDQTAAWSPIEEIQCKEPEQWPSSSNSSRQPGGCTLVGLCGRCPLCLEFQTLFFKLGKEHLSFNLKSTSWIRSLPLCAGSSHIEVIYLFISSVDWESLEDIHICLFFSPRHPHKYLTHCPQYLYIDKQVSKSTNERMKASLSICGTDREMTNCGDPAWDWGLWWMGWNDDMESCHHTEPEQGTELPARYQAYRKHRDRTRLFT